MGLQLPSLLRRMYTDIANGGFGPGYGFIGVDGGATDDIGKSIVNLYVASQSEQFRKRFPNWPKGIVRFCYWGCAMYSAIDCLSPDFPVYHLNRTQMNPISDSPTASFLTIVYLTTTLMLG